MLTDVVKLLKEIRHTHPMLTDVVQLLKEIRHTHPMLTDVVKLLKEISPKLRPNSLHQLHQNPGDSILHVDLLLQKVECALHKTQV